MRVTVQLRSWVLLKAALVVAFLFLASQYRLKSPNRNFTWYNIGTTFL